MHGLILAGGLGSRLAADGVGEPKALVPIAGRPQLGRLCDTLDALGCATITCLVREGVAAAEAVGSSPRRRLLYCATPSSLHTLVLGLEAVPPGPVFCTMVDTVMPWESWRAVWSGWISASAGGVPAMVAVSPPSPRDEAPLWVEVDSTYRVTHIGGAAAPSRWCTAGVYGLAPAARQLAAVAAAEGVSRMRGFLARLVLSGLEIRAIPVARALDLDRRADVEEANAWRPAEAP
jgi:NDP-sugar pyrophosphorylase family protein